jgi:hypothetical protein
MGMMTRSVLGCVLLVLAAFSVLQIALDGASFRAPDHQQWRAPSHHQGAARPPRRNTNGIPAASPAAPVLSLSGLVVLADCPDVLSPPLAGVFVPPRV